MSHNEFEFEKKLVEHGFNKFKHKKHWDMIFWSKTDLLKTDYFKEWFRA